MAGEILVPAVGESITEVVVSKWLVPVGTWVAADTPLVALDTDKASVEVVAPIDGFLKSVAKAADEEAEIGAVLGIIEAAERPADAADAPSPEPAAPAAASVS